MAQLKQIFSAYVAGDGYIANIEIELNGAIIRCPYGVIREDTAPIGQQLLAAIESGEVTMIDPPAPPPSPQPTESFDVVK